MQTLDDTITDFTPPVYDKCVQEYQERFRYGHVDKSGSTCMKSKRTVRRKPRKKGGLLPLAALSLGGISRAAGYGVKKGLEAALCNRRR